MPAQSKGAAAAALELVGNCGQSLDRRDHVIGIAAVKMDAGHSEIAVRGSDSRDLRIQNRSRV